MPSSSSPTVKLDLLSQMSLSRLLAAVVGYSRRNALLMVVAGILIAGASSWLAATHLGLSTDTDLLFSDKLPWRQRQIAWNKAFPQSQDLLVAVVDGTVPEIADETASNLATELAPDHTHFQEVWGPDASPYLEQNGLMFLDEKTLSGLLDQTIDAQPFLGQLVADPSARGLFAALGLVAMGAERGEAELGPFADSLKAFHTSLAAAAAGHPEPLSWQNLLAGSLASQAGPYRFVLIRPHLDYGALSPGGAATQAVRDAAARLEFVRSGQAHVRITGSVALADEEFATVAQGAVAGTIISAVLIALWLLLAVRTWRLIVPILYTLLLGLALTLGFATIAVGTLNLISVAFAILFVGIAVDFAIQFSVRYRAERLAAVDAESGLTQTAERVGPQILVAAAATAAGFLAFVPTDFSGVAELGLIAGGGMVIAFFCTIIFLPAALTLLRPRPGARAVGFHWGDPAERWLRHNRRVVLTGFVALGALGAVLLPRLTFDSDPLHTKNPNTEAMRTLNDLMSSPLTNPYSIDILTPSLDAANALAAKLRPLSLVDSVLTLSSFVPQDQEAKLALIADAANILGPTLSASPASAPVTAADLRMSARTTRDQIEKALPKLPKDSPLIPIAEDLRVLADAPDATLLAANTALTRFLPAMIDRLRHVLDAKPVTIADVPQQISRDWILPDGRARVQVMSKPGARDSRGLHEFVAQVQAIAPDAGGSAVTIVETAATIVGAFRSAAIAALIAIAVILSLVLRRALDVALVMTPLVLSSLLTVVFAVLLPLPLNFANIIALPLLLGVGVSFNIYFVMNWRAGARRFLGTATARAIVFSALTTATAFGSLALSAHPGTASMGDLLMLSLGCTLVTTLFFVPTLLGVLGPMIVRRRHAVA